MTNEDIIDLATDQPNERIDNDGFLVNKPADREAQVLIGCTMLFITALLGAVVTSPKVQMYNIFSGSFLIPAGTILFCLAYLATDVISEIWGRSYAVIVVLFGVLMRLIVLGYFYFAISGEVAFNFIDAAPFWTSEQQSAYSTTLGGSQLIIWAGLVAFFISSLMDVFIFHYFKERHKNKNMLWFRNTVSTSLSQLVNSVFFISIAFATVASLSQILSLILGQVVVKVLVSILDTPLVYIIRNYAMRKKIFDFSG